MAEVSYTKIPYEILIRFDGTGRPIGAHAQYRRTVSVNGEVLKDEILLAEPLGLIDFPTSEIMTETTAAALAQVNVLSSSLSTAEAAVAARDVQVAEMARVISRLESALASVQTN